MTLCGFPWRYGLFTGGLGATTARNASARPSPCPATSTNVGSAHARLRRDRALLYRPAPCISAIGLEIRINIGICPPASAFRRRTVDRGNAPQSRTSSASHDEYLRPFPKSWADVSQSPNMVCTFEEPFPAIIDPPPVCEGSTGENLSDATSV